jgi:hypothetical protein
MPIYRELDSVERVLRTTVTSPVTLNDIRQHVGAVRRSGSLGIPEIIDVRLSGSSSVSKHQLLSLAHQARRSLADRTPARRAIVVGSESAFGTARLFAALVAGWLRFGVFEDLVAAEEWVRGRLS